MTVGRPKRAVSNSGQPLSILKRRPALPTPFELAALGLGLKAPLHRRPSGTGRTTLGRGWPEPFAQQSRKTPQSQSTVLPLRAFLSRYHAQTIALEASFEAILKSGATERPQHAGLLQVKYQLHTRIRGIHPLTTGTGSAREAPLQLRLRDNQTLVDDAVQGIRTELDKDESMTTQPPAGALNLEKS